MRLFDRAAKLPRVEIKRPQKSSGRATVEAMQSGLYHGYIGLVDGILKKMIDELGRSPTSDCHRRSRTVDCQRLQIHPGS